MRSCCTLLLNVSSAGDALSIKLKEMVRTGVFELDEDPGIAGSALIRELLKGHSWLHLCLSACVPCLSVWLVLSVCLVCLRALLPGRDILTAGDVGVGSVVEEELFIKMVDSARG